MAKAKQPKGVETTIVVTVGANGKIKRVMENNQKLKYARGQIKKMDGGTSRLVNPTNCCWIRTPAGWKCIPKSICCP